MVQYDEAMVEQEYGVVLSDLKTYLAILGDKSDNIKGITGLGKKRTPEFIRKGDPLKLIDEVYPTEGQRVRLNLKLIDLLDPETYIHELKEEDIICRRSDIVNLNLKFRELEINSLNAKDLISTVRCDYSDLIRVLSRPAVETRFNNN
jgi:5'-3' exonuclease